MYSKTYAGLVTMLFGFLFQGLGVPFVEGDLEKWVVGIFEFGGLLWAAWGRWRLGGVSLLGFRKS